MKQNLHSIFYIFLFYAFIFLPVTPLQAQINPAGGTYTVGERGDFTSLTNEGGVFQALNGASISGPQIFHVISNILNETGQYALNQVAGASENNFIEFRPQDGLVLYTISGDVSVDGAGLFKLNGADWVRFDGRAVGETAEGLGVGMNLALVNTGTGVTLSLSGDATNNLFSYLRIQGRTASNNHGVVTIGEGATTGNDFNQFLFSKVGGTESNFPVNTIYSKATAAVNNDITVKGNLFNSFATTGSINDDFPSVILIAGGNNNWNIADNHFYQETATTPVADDRLFAFRGIRVLSGSHKIIGNYLGGQSTFAGGVPLLVTGDGGINNYPSVLPFSIETGTNDSVLIQDNTITNMTIVGTPSLCDAVAFGNLALNGKVNFIGNTFGDPTGQTSINVSTNVNFDHDLGAYNVVPIFYKAKSGSSTRGVVKDNYIGSYVFSGNRQGSGKSSLIFIGIQTNINARVREITNNRIENVAAINLTGNLGVGMVGINSLGGTTTDITRNIICKFNNYSSVEALQCSDEGLTPGPFVVGILVNNLDGDALVANNIIYFNNLATKSTTVFYGIIVSTDKNEPTFVYFNTVFITGEDNNASGGSYVFYRKGVTLTTVKNNIFLNTRSTDNINFVIGTKSPTGFISDYNLLYRQSGNATVNDFGQYGSEGFDSFSAWLSGTPFDKNSLNVDVANNFVDPSVCNLRIQETIPVSPVVDAGTVVVEVNTDIDNVVRINPDMGASEGYNTWLGTVSSDWNNGQNWSTGNAPTCTQYNLVRINPLNREEGIIFQPVINNETAYFRNMVLFNEASVTLANPNAVLEQCGVANPLIEGINNRGTVLYTEPGEIILLGILDNKSTIIPGSGTLTLAGSNNVQLINSVDTLQLNNLTVRGGAPKQLNTPAFLRGAINLQNGLVQTTNTNIITMDVNSTVAGVTETSYVSGPLRRNFNKAETFIFPVGDEQNGGRYLGRAGVSTLSTQPTTFRAQYFRPNPLPTANQFIDNTLADVSAQEAWAIQRVVGTGRATVILYWGASSGVTNPDDLRVGYWLGSAWTNVGNEGIDKFAVGGRIFSAPALNRFGTFTLASFAGDNPLPVTLTKFVANIDKEDVVLDWETVSEKNSSHFNVQRSLDGATFQNFGRVQAAGNSIETKKYVYKDERAAQLYAGNIYYRLEQVDFDGTIEYSPVERVYVQEKAIGVQGIYPNPFRDNQDLVVNINTDKEQRVIVRMISLNGMRMLEQEKVLGPEDNIFNVKGTYSLEPGVYLLEIEAPEFVKQIRVVKL